MSVLQSIFESLDDTRRDTNETTLRQSWLQSRALTNSTTSCDSQVQSIQRTLLETIRNNLTRLAVVVFFVCLFGADPALAQTTTEVTPQPSSESNVICDAANLPSMIEGFFRLTTGLGIIGLVVVYQADSLIEMYKLDPDQKQTVERHKRSAIKSTIVLVVLGPLYTVAGATMGLPLAQCVDLVPW